MLAAFCAALFAIGGVSAAQSANEPMAHMITLKTGVSLNYVSQGNEHGPVIVLLHGAGDSWHSYARVLPLLPTKYRVYAITMRGHGLSDHPETGYSRAEFAADILDFMDQMHLQHATLVGHSLGSLVAQKVAEEDTGHLDRLVLIGSGPGVRRASASGQALHNAFAAVKDPIPYTFARDFQASTIYAPVPAWFFEMMVGEAQRLPAATWHGIGDSSLNNATLDDLKKIRIPTLVCWGEKDSIFHRADEDLLMKTLPHATFSEYAETGHALHWERPERFTRELLAFIQGGPSTAKKK